MAPLAEASSLATEQATVLKHKIVKNPQESQSEALWDEDVTNNNEQSSKGTDHTIQETMIAESLDVQEPAKKRVRFNVADVVEFEPTMWTATVSSEGVPLGMSVEVRCRTKRPLDTYEIERVTQRVDRQEYMELGYLEPEERLDILENAGHSISIISHIERDTLRINRERWESNEYDLMYQYGLGEVPLIENGSLETVQQSHGDDNMNDSSEDFFFSAAAGTWLWTLNIDYASNCIMGDDESSDENNELPYALDSFDSPESCDFLEMGTLPLDTSDSSDRMLGAATATSCAQSASTASGASSVTESSNMSVKVAPFVAV
ncbi:unnamed protein product [Peronospora destructor]|uniref:Uncharacterized protein n=1 Tax=Peronospora destructor TaxID=86335 RepID=A0AAV0V853_9STRA|nr:unnamed protein product [Peronospora destructor]